MTPSVAVSFHRPVLAPPPATFTITGLSEEQFGKLMALVGKTEPG